MKLILKPDKNTAPGTDRLSNDIDTYDKADITRLERRKKKDSFREDQELTEDLRELMKD